MPVRTSLPRQRMVRISATLTESTLAAMASYTVTARRGPKVERLRFEELTAALDAIEAQGHSAEQGAHAKEVGGGIVRKIEPVQQVVARLELSGPRRLRAGVDVRGDGSSESYTGRVRRRLIEQHPGESAYDALRRELRRT